MPEVVRYPADDDDVVNVDNEAHYRSANADTWQQTTRQRIYFYDVTIDESIMVTSTYFLTPGFLYNIYD